MWWLILIPLNIPIYYFIGWVMFNSKTGDPANLSDTIIAITKIILFPRWFRELVGMDTDEAVGVFDLITFLVMCAAVTYGEYWLLNYLFGWK